MRIHSVLLALATSLCTTAAEPSPPAAGKSEAVAVSRESALDNLLAERDSIKAFEKAVGVARKSGVSDQAILEARFLFHVDRREDAMIAAMLPEFLKRRDQFKLEDSAIFAVREDWLAVIEYVQAIDALAKGEKDAFKKHITEAFWLSPSQASAFAPHIERMRLDETMRSVKVDFSIKLIPLAPGDPVALESLIKGKKALLFHFWSPMSQECEASMPDFVASAAMLVASNFAVVSLIPNDAPKLLDDARGMIRPLGDKPPGAWLVDSKENSLGRELRVQNLPTMVLVSPDGKILFNGDPTDEMFWNALKKIDARVERPDATKKDSE
jgi:hypothetical protein